MHSDERDKLYAGVPQDQLDHLRRFQETHAPKHLQVEGVAWEYMVSGAGKDTLLVLTGGLRYAPAMFPYIELLEDSCRVIAPSYPPVKTMDALVAGLVAILQTEKIARCHVLGQSFGGLLAQCFSVLHPDKVQRLILSNTGSGSSGAIRSILRLNLRLLSLLPQKYLLTSLKRRMLSLLSVPEDWQAFWRAYFDELFGLHITLEDFESLLHNQLDYVEHLAPQTSGREAWAGPVLIIESETDPGVPRASQAALKERYPHAWVHTFLSAGHTPALGKSDEYAAVVKRFLLEV